jgi:hypothetical protein
MSSRSLSLFLIPFSAALAVAEPTQISIEALVAEIAAGHPELRYDEADGRVWSVGPDLKDDAGAVDAECESNDVVVKPR